MSSGDLKEEYRRLQEQQKKKLERVKELRQAKQQQQQQQQQQQALTFGINDDLGLHTAGPDHPQVAESAQVEADLRDQLRGLDDENARLKKLVQERDFELAQARKKLAQRQRPPVDEAPSLGGGGGGGGEGAAAVKVMELSRKVRELTAEVEAERAKSAKASRRLKEVEAEQARRMPAKEAPAEVPLAKSEREELEVELRRARERLSEVRSQQQNLTKELRLAKKALSEETGLPEGNLREMLQGNPGGWRGRQQSIITLEAQVRDLKRQVASLEAERGPVPFLELQGSNGATSLGRDQLPSEPRSDLTSAATFRSGQSSSRQHAALQRMQKERREKAEQERAERAEVLAENTELKKKLESARARIVTLSSELKAQKSQVETLLRKGKHDDELIQSLTKREKALHELLEQNLQAKALAENSQRSTMEQVNLQKAQETQILDRMKEIVRDKEAIIQVKEGQIASLQRLLDSREGKEVSGKAKEDDEEEERELKEEEDSEGEPGGPVQPTFEVQSTNGASAKKSTKNAAERPPSSRLSAKGATDRPSSSRLSSARSAKGAKTAPDCPPSSRPSSRLLPRPDPNLAIDLEDLRTQLRAVEVERDRLRELLAVQDGRFQEALAQRAAAEQQLAGLRRRSAALERQNNGGGTTAAAADLTDVERLISSDDLPANRTTIQQLQEALAMCHEEVATRKQALKAAMDAKEQDVRWLMEITEKTRQVYLSGIQRVKQQKGT